MAKKQGVIKDLGEKIGGARKDMAAKTGPRAPRGSVVDTDTRPAWMRRFVPIQNVRTKEWQIADTGVKSRWGVKTVGGTFPTEEAAQKAVPLAAVARNHRVRDVSKSGESPRFEIWRDVTDRKRVRVVAESFPDRESAMLHMAKNAEKIIETKTGFGEEILVRPEKVYRTGPAARAGDIAGESFMKALGMRGVEFGNWQGERQSVMNHAYDAMHDLAHVTGIDPKDVSLKGDLAIAFGARGHGLSSARAHYEPKYGAINLTKMEGAGALAHEWWHGIDHMLGRLDDQKLAELDPKSGTKAFATHLDNGIFASHRVTNAYRKGDLPENVRTAYKDLMDSLYHKPEQYTEDAARAEKFTAATSKELSEYIDRVRKGLTEKLTYGKRNVNPATAEQLARFDAAAEKIRAGEKTEFKSVTPKGNHPSSRYSFNSRWTSPALEDMSAVFKEVRGRSGFDSQHSRGVFDELAGHMRRHEQRTAMLKDAAAQSVKTRMVPTNYSMQARRLDEGRVGDYWQVKHEMAARAFSAYVEDKLAAANRRSDYLSYGSDNKFYALLDQKPFPEGAERQLINQKFDALFDAMRESNVVRAGASVGRAVTPTGTPDIHAAMKAAPTNEVGPGIKTGWSDAAREKSAEVRKTEAALETRPSNADFNYPGAERYGAGPGAKVRADARVSILNSASGGNGGWEAVQTKEGEWVVRHDGKTNPAPQPEKYTPTHTPPLREVRNTGNSKRFLVYEDGKAIKDAKGQDKWFSTKEKAEAYLAKRESIAKTFGGSPKVMSYEQALKAAQGKVNTVTGEPHLAITAQTLSQAHPGVSAKMLYDGAKASGISARELAKMPANKLADLMFAETSSLPKAGKAQPDYTKPAKDKPARAAVAGDNGAPPDAQIKAAKRLEEVAKRTIEEAQKVHDQPRLMNTARRARLGSGVMEEQQRKIANAKTALRIAEALREGTASPELAKVQSLADVERLTTAYRQALYNNRAKREQHRGSMVGVEPDASDIAHAKPQAFVRANLSQSDINLLKGALKGKGVSKDLARLEKNLERGDLSWRLETQQDVDALRNVANAVKSIKGSKNTSWAEYPWQVNRIQSDANRWLGEVRSYDADRRLGLSEPESLRGMLKAYADVRVDRPKPNAARAAELDLVGRKIPGFFPTPESLAKRMAEIADIKAGMTVLEPSAGSGRLADIAKGMGAKVDAVEMHSSLRDILTKKGHNVVEHDFTTMVAEPKYDRVLMNPPFEKGQDMVHVQRAYDMLKPGGTMVAIMGEGAFFRGDKQAEGFRSWLNGVGGTSEKLPEGTFKESNTGVNTRLVTITKPGPVEAPKEHHVWDDKARAASAAARANGLTRPNNPIQSAGAPVLSAVDRAMAKSQERSATAPQSTLAAPGPRPDHIPGVGNPQESYWTYKTGPTPTLADLPKGAIAEGTTEAQFSSLSPGMRREIARQAEKKRVVTLGDGRKVPLGKYVEAWQKAKSLPPETPVRGTPSDPIGGGTAADVLREMRAGMDDRINRKDPSYGKGRKWDDSWQNDARRLAETLKMKSEVPAGQAHPVDLRGKIAHRLEDGTAIPKKGGSRVKGKVLGVLGPVAIGAAMLTAANEAKASETSEIAAAGKAGAASGAVLAGFTGATALAVKGLVKAGMTAARAIPVVQGALIAGGAVHGALTAKPGERLKGAAKGAWDMSLPGMVVNTAKDVSDAVADRVALENEQRAKFASANATYSAMKSREASASTLRGFQNPNNLAAALAAQGKTLGESRER